MTKIFLSIGTFISSYQSHSWLKGIGGNQPSGSQFINLKRNIRMSIDNNLKFSSTLSECNSTIAKRSLQKTLNVDQPFPHRGDTSINSSKWKKPRVIGHRGSLYHALENTRQSFRLATEEGCDGIELDVFLLKCGTLVVFHGSDGSHDEQPGGLKDYCTVNTGCILDYTAQEAREILTFNPTFDEFGCGPDYIRTHIKELYIPTLRQVLLDAKKKGIIVKIELKGPNTALPTLQLVEELDMVDTCHYSSFRHDEIKIIRDLRPEKNSDGSFRYKTGALFDQVPDNFISLAHEVGASEIHLKYSTCTKQRIETIHKEGMDSMAWMRGPRGMQFDLLNTFDDVGNEDDSMYSILIATGVRNLCVNRPDRLVDYLKRHQDHFFE